MWGAAQHRGLQTTAGERPASSDTVQSRPVAATELLEDDVDEPKQAKISSVILFGV